MDIGKIYGLAQDAEDAAADARSKVEALVNELDEALGEDGAIDDGDTADLIQAAIDALQDGLDDLHRIEIA